jgi:predicted GIY-YIG superfamily endonuclease
MVTRSIPKQFDKRAVRNWTLYVLKLTDGHYYIGITARKDFMHRINQHGGRLGAKVNRNKTIEEIVEVHPLGKMSGAAAEHIENDCMLQYRKKFGASKVRGGYDVLKSTPIVPTYTPGSIQSYTFIIVCLLLAIISLIFIVRW